jgi:hypothetical protein
LNTETIPMNPDGPRRPRGGARSANHLNDGQKLKLWERLRGMEAELAAERPAHRPLAERLSREMGFRVTRNNVIGAIEAGVVPAWDPVEDPRASVRGLSELNARVGRLERMIERLYSELGVEADGPAGRLPPEQHIIPPSPPVPPVLPAPPGPSSPPGLANFGHEAEIQDPGAATTYGDGAAADRQAVAEQAPGPAGPGPEPEPRCEYPRTVVGPKAAALRSPLPEGAGCDDVPDSQRWRASLYEFRVAVFVGRIADQDAVPLWVVHVLHHGMPASNHSTRRRKERMVDRIKRSAERALGDVGCGRIVGNCDVASSHQEITLYRRLTAQEIAWMGLPPPLR